MAQLNVSPQECERHEKRYNVYSVQYYQGLEDC